jgi:glycosyltransferase involved in cell wall biosynthesis
MGGAKRLLKASERNYLTARDRLGGIDLIHAHVSYPAGFMAAELRKKYGVPYVITEHMGPFPFATMMQAGQPMWQIRHALNNAERIIAVSPSLAARIESFGFTRVQTIPNLVNEDQFCPADLASAKVSDSKFVFFTLGNLVPQKGVGDLLKAIALWDPPADEVEFWIGGEGPHAAQYQQQAAALGIADRVKWLGQVPREDAPSLFQQCDCFVLPSLHETFGVVLAEAIACGKRVIATRCGGPESIVTRTNGQLVAPKSPAELSQALAAMRVQHAQYDPTAIRQSFVSRFSRQAVTQQIVEMYEAVLS